MYQSQQHQTCSKLSRLLYCKSLFSSSTKPCDSPFPALSDTSTLTANLRLCDVALGYLWTSSSEFTARISAAEQRLGPAQLVRHAVIASLLRKR